MMEMRCVRCGLTPDQIPEYVAAAQAETEMGDPMTPNDYVAEEEGTLNQFTGKFACTECYIAMGQPSGPHGWTP